eukprot:TRINITY_DN1614_c0_g1_i1.p1 TRINITY_DN1614_c0_g1~~TRINITY_DN1614_c0_g1_i1.p1  ORF type:complete len:137 (-),score=16.88 TRINITY_DN1614_c0_g1_i1:79-450(-)
MSHVQGAALLGRSNLAHRQHVCRLYRRSLKTALDWLIDRRLWYTRATEIRSRFRANMNLDDPRAISRAVIAAENELAAWRHPDPYIPADSPGGSKYQRNTPVPPYLVENGWAEWDVETNEYVQ